MTHRVTSRARPINLESARNATEQEAVARFHLGYAGGLARLPIGRQVFHGLPFDLGPADGRRWILLDRPATINLEGAGPASHVVIAHLSDAWRGDEGRRPAGVPLGHVVPVGEVLAEYTVVERSGRRTSRPIRRRFEVNDGLLGWGSGAFGAVGHRQTEVLDWRGPHAAQVPGRYAPTGQSGSLTIIPGSYGTDLTGVSDFVPSGSDDLLLWLYAFALEAGAQPLELRLEPRSGGRPGSDLIVAAVTLFNGSASPLVRSPRGQVRVGGTAGEPPGIDLGTIIRSRPVRHPARLRPSANEPPIIGWGTPRLEPAVGPTPLAVGEAGEALVVDLAFAPDAVVSLGDWPVAARELVEGRPIVEPGGRRSIELLPPARIPVEVEIVDRLTGERLPARVQFATPDGRYLPPSGHRDEINPGFFEDTGGDLVLGGSTYAYVPGRFEIDLPVGEVELEVVAGFGRPPVATTIRIEPSTRRLELPLEPRLDLTGAGRWISADSHVHFLAPSTALLQAAAEDVDLVNLLAAQWGDLFTNVTDLPWGSMADPDGRRIIVVGTENRQNQLGHLALLGAHRPTNPLASGGPPEGRLAGALSVLLADWADRCRAAGGLVVAAHFPLPYAEIAADIVSGRIDAVETQALSPGLDDPSVLEWYRFLNLGYRLPLVAGTDKMTAEVPVGAVRAYTHLPSDEPLTFDGWAVAVRAGRTFVSSGPLLELSVDGQEPGAVVELPSAGRLEVSLRARAAQPVLNELELIVNGRVVASTSPATGAAGSTELGLHESIEIRAGSWIAGRVRSRVDIQSAFTTAMAAHTSAVYVEVQDAPLVPPSGDGAAVEQIIVGARTWVAELAAIAEPAERERMLTFFDASLAALERRISGRA